MRTVVLVASLLLVGTFSISANTSAPLPGKFKVRTTLENQFTLNLAMVNLQKTQTVVTFRSLSAIKPIYKEVIQDHHGYRMALKLDELPEGRYVLEVKNGEQQKRQVVRVLRNAVLLSKISE